MVAVHQPVTGVPYSEMSRGSVAEERVVDVMPKSLVPGVKVRLGRFRPVVRSLVAVVHTAEPKRSELVNHHAVVPSRMHLVPDRIAVEVPHQQGLVTR